MQVMQQMAPKPPMDPAQILMAETQRKAALDQAKNQLDAQKLQLQAAHEARQQQIDQGRIQAEMAGVQARAQMNAEDNTTAKELAVFEAEQGQKARFTTGHGINP
jgi:hypothetical protein